MKDKPSSPHLQFTRAEWAHLRDGTPLNLTARELERLKGINERVSLEEVETIYLPMCRLLNLYVGATQDLFKATAEFLGHPEPKVPYVIGLAGSVAVGKSTTGRILQTLLSRWPNSPKVDLLTTDGFLYPNRVLEERGLMQRKGFPESYDQSALLAFVSDIKAGEGAVKGPVYSHLTYDIVDGEYIEVDRPDIVIIEGLNVLQTAPTQRGMAPRLFVSDFFDFSIYVDARVEDLRRWYVARFLTLRNTAFKDPSSYFHRYASMTDSEARAFANSVWSEINEVNLRENILPTRERADLILEKSADHSVRRVQLRKI